MKEVACEESPGRMTYKWFLLNRWSERSGAGGVLRRTFNALRGGRARAWRCGVELSSCGSYSFDGSKGEQERGRRTRRWA